MPSATDLETLSTALRVSVAELEAMPRERLELLTLGDVGAGLELPDVPGMASDADEDDGLPDFDLDRALSEGQPYLDDYAALERAAAGEAEEDDDQPNDDHEEGTTVERVSYERWRAMFNQGPVGVARARQMHSAGLVDYGGELGDIMDNAKGNRDVRAKRERPKVSVTDHEPVSHEKWKAMFHGTPEERATAKALFDAGKVEAAPGFERAPAPAPADGKPVAFDDWRSMLSGTPEDRATAVQLHRDGLVKAPPGFPERATGDAAPRPAGERVSYDAWRSMFSGPPEDRAEAVRLHRDGLVQTPDL